MLPAWFANNARHLGYALIGRLSCGMSRPAAFRIADRLADVWWRCARAPREAVESNLDRLHGGDAARPGAAREVFRNFARYLVEFFTADRQQAPVVAIEGRHHVERALHGGQGAIMLTGHLGNWELGAVEIARLGLPITVVALPHAHDRTNRLFLRQRARCGVDVIELGADAGRRCLRNLAGGRLLGVVGDQDFRGDGIRVRFGAGTLTVPRGPALLSLRSGAPIIPVFLLREGPWKFRLAVEPPIHPETGFGAPDAAEALTRRCAALLERYVLRHPDQWLMFTPVLAS